MAATSVADTLSYDADQNVTAVLGAGYGYDARDELTWSDGATYAYDPLGRLYRAVGAADARFQYDGVQAAAEYDASGAVTRRYVPGPSIDEPVVAYAGSGTSIKTWLLADERGSVIGIADGSGAATVNRYDEYGVPASANTGRFQYTGQMWLEDAEVYHYRARAYAPQIGRFLQSDPMGYGAGMNLYAYVGGDPVNRVDPMGYDWCAVTTHPSIGGGDGDGTESGTIPKSTFEVVVYYLCDHGVSGMGGSPDLAQYFMGGASTPEGMCQLQMFASIAQDASRFGMQAGGTVAGFGAISSAFGNPSGPFLTGGGLAVFSLSAALGSVGSGLDAFGQNPEGVINGVLSTSFGIITSPSKEFAPAIDYSGSIFIDTISAAIADFLPRPHDSPICIYPGAGS